MARNISPDSVSSKVADLTLGEHLRLDNPYTSVMVMVSNLKKKECLFIVYLCFPLINEES